VPPAYPIANPIANPSRQAFTLASLLLLSALPAAAQSLTVVTLTITSPTTMSYGQIVDGSAQVSALDGTTPSGTMTFYDGSTPICAVTIAPSAACPASAGEGFATGTHTVTAVYTGDSTHAPSTSNAVTLTVRPDTTTAQLTATPNPAAAGQPITITATLQGTYATPTGLITLYDASDPIATAPLNATGVATFTLTTLAAGSHPLTAFYRETTDFAANTSPTFTEQVQSSPTPSFTIATNPITVRTGQTATAPITITPANGFHQPVTLACNNLAPYATCTFSPATIPTGSTTTTLQINTNFQQGCPTTALQTTSHTVPIAAVLIALLLPRRRSIRSLLTLLIAATAITTITGCGAGLCTDPATPPGTYTLTITGTSTSATASQKITLNVTN
jgi:hypothetical protein